MLNTYRSNPYVEKNLIEQNISLLREQHARQTRGAVIQIPNKEIRAAVAELRRRLSAVNAKIYTIEQLSFAFGG